MFIHDVSGGRPFPFLSFSVGVYAQYIPQCFTLPHQQLQCILPVLDPTTKIEVATIPNDIKLKILKANREMLSNMMTLSIKYCQKSDEITNIMNFDSY